MRTVRWCASGDERTGAAGLEIARELGGALLAPASRVDEPRDERTRVIQRLGAGLVSAALGEEQRVGCLAHGLLLVRQQLARPHVVQRLHDASVCLCAI